MEFPFDINQLFTERVSILDQTLIAGRKAAGRPDLQAQIATVIDELGRASAKAQQLTAAITSASKMQSQRHQLYLLKDGERNGGRGVVVGFLKVGYKKLFLLDRHGVHVEAEPLCVLDFYVAENLQRHGYGLELFDFVLQHKNLEPVLMAYDRPSPKFLSFLAKHYCLTQSVPQVNNFVVFEGFFFNRSAAQLRKVPLKKPEGEIKPYSLMEREVVRQEQRSLPWPFAPPHSPQRSVSSQYSHSLSVGSSPTRARVSTASGPGGTRELSPQSPLIDRCRARRTSQQGLVARSCLYSRHLDSSALEQLDTPLPGLRAVGDESCALGHTDTHITTPQSRSLSAPPQPAASGAPEVSTQRPPEAETPGVELQVSPGGPPPAPSQPTPDNAAAKDSSWTVANNCFTAQWIKHKLEYKSTRPW